MEAHHYEKPAYQQAETSFTKAASVSHQAETTDRMSSEDEVSEQEEEEEREETGSSEHRTAADELMEEFEFSSRNIQFVKDIGLGTFGKV